MTVAILRTRRAALLIAALALACAVGCHKEGPAEKAGREIDDAAEKAGDAVKDAGDKAKDAAEKAGDKVKDAVD